jgi:hypothetical protein
MSTPGAPTAGSQPRYRHFLSSLIWLGLLKLPRPALNHPTRGTQARNKTLSHDSSQGVREKKGLNPQIQQPNDRSLNRSRMQRGDNAVSREGGLDRNGGGGRISHLSNENHVRILTQYRTQATQQPQPINVQLQTQQIDTAVARAMDTIAAQAAEQIRQVADAMPINITTPAPVVNVTTPTPVVNVTAPAVSFEATVPQAQVVVAHPARAVQTVERDANDEILRTVTTYEGA